MRWCNVIDGAMLVCLSVISLYRKSRRCPVADDVPVTQTENELDLGWHHDALLLAVRLNLPFFVES